MGFKMAWNAFSETQIWKENAGQPPLTLSPARDLHRSLQVFGFQNPPPPPPPVKKPSGSSPDNSHKRCQNVLNRYC